MALHNRERKLVLVVGSRSNSRTEVARRLISDDNAVVLCPGPPGCPLLRDEPCVLAETADMTIIMPGTSHAPEVVTGLGLCARSSSRVIRPNIFDRPSNVDPTAVSRAVRDCFDLEG